MKRFLLIGAILLAVAAIGAFLFIPKDMAQEQAETVRVSFANHLAVPLKFTVDGVYVCTASAGMSCSADVTFGKHVFKALELEGDKVVREVEATIDKNTVNPRMVICSPTSPDC